MENNLNVLIAIFIILFLHESIINGIFDTILN